MGRPFNTLRISLLNTAHIENVMALIKDLYARMILDSRGNPTVECELTTDNGVFRAAVPSGASTGSFEAHELRDNETRWGGKGVTKAVSNINTTIKKKIVGMRVDQHLIDSTLIALDGTENKQNLGANAILAVSMANMRAGAPGDLYEHIQLLTKRKAILPIPFSNVINGGKHAAGNLQLQEFMLVPWKFKQFDDALRAVVETYHELKTLVEKTCPPGSANLGDEGGCAPILNTAEEALNLIEQAAKRAGYDNKIKIAIDAAASEFYNKKSKTYNIQNSSALQLADYYLSLIKHYPIISLEDPFHEEDFEAFAHLTKKSKIQIVGDDLLVTNTKRMKTAIDRKSCNALLLKVNQIGTVSEAIDAAQLAFKNKWNVMVSHRSGETSDTFIADLSVALGCGQIKAGAPARSDRTEKYNQLLRIAESGIKYQSSF